MIGTDDVNVREKMMVKVMCMPIVMNDGDRYSTKNEQSEKTQKTCTIESERSCIL